MKFLTLEEELDIKSNNNVLYFYSTWLPFHKKMLIMLSKAESKYKHVNFTAIDVDSFKSICKRFDITNIPTVILLKNKDEVARIVGMVLTSAFIPKFKIYKEDKNDK